MDRSILGGPLFVGFAFEARTLFERISVTQKLGCVRTGRTFSVTLKSLGQRDFLAALRSVRNRSVTHLESRVRCVRPPYKRGTTEPNLPGQRTREKYPCPVPRSPAQISCPRPQLTWCFRWSTTAQGPGISFVHKQTLILTAQPHGGGSPRTFLNPPPLGAKSPNTNRGPRAAHHGPPIWSRRCRTVPFGRTA
jgi:hypothetical protein